MKYVLNYFVQFVVRKKPHSNNCLVYYRGDASEVESASETLGNTSYYTRRELDSLNKTTDFASKDYKKVTEYSNEQ